MKTQCSPTGGWKEREEWMTGRLQDKVALLLGAGSRGPGWCNGKATAIVYARGGAKVIAVDRNLAAALETAASRARSCKSGRPPGAADHPKGVRAWVR